jgi:ATP synthase protein I
MENGDPWQRPGLRTADCGPRLSLPAFSGLVTAMSSAGQESGSQRSGRDDSPGPPPRTAAQLGYARRRPDASAQPRESDGYRILSYMLGGMILYGGIGWLIGHWTGLSFLFPVGMLVGLALGIWLIIFRVTKT